MFLLTLVLVPLIGIFILTLGYMLMLKKNAFKINSFSIKQSLDTWKKNIFNLNFWFSVFAIFFIGLSIRIGITTIYNSDIFRCYTDPISIGYYLLMAFIAVFVKQVINRKGLALFCAFFIFLSVSIFYCVYIYDISSFISNLKKFSCEDIILIVSYCVSCITLEQVNPNVCYSSSGGDRQVGSYTGAGGTSVLNPYSGSSSGGDRQVGSYIGPGGTSVLNPNSSSSSGGNQQVGSYRGPPLTVNAARPPVPIFDANTYNVTIPQGYNMAPFSVADFAPRVLSTTRYDPILLEKVFHYLEVERSRNLRLTGCEPIMSSLLKQYVYKKQIECILKDYILNVSSNQTVSSDFKKYISDSNRVKWNSVPYAIIRPAFTTGNSN